MSETDVAFARSCPRGVETDVAFARAGRASDETVIAFAGEKWVFLVRLSVAEVSPVSTLAVQGRAVVMAVSRWPASAAAEVSLVSTSPRRCVLRANKFAQRTTTQIGVLWCAGRTLSRGGSEGTVPGEFCRATSHARPLPGDLHLGSNRKPTCRVKGQKELVEG